MITDYLNVNLVEELGLDKFSKENQQKLVNQINEVLNNRLSFVIMENLSEEDKKELDVLLDKDDSDVDKFLRDKIPTFDLIIAEQIAELKKEILDMQGRVEEARGNSNE